MEVESAFHEFSQDDDPGQRIGNFERGTRDAIAAKVPGTSAATVSRVIQSLFGGMLKYQTSTDHRLETGLWRAYQLATGGDIEPLRRSTETPDDPYENINTEGKLQTDHRSKKRPESIK